MVRMRSCSTMRASRARPPAALGAAPHQDDLAALQTELARVRGEREQLHAVLADVLAELAQLGVELAQTQAQLAAVKAERQEVHQELVDLKRKPFAAQRRIDDVPSTKPRGRPVGHPGSGRSQPLRIDHTPPIPVGQTCPDCGSAFRGAGTSRERVIEDIDLVRPTIVTKYVIERRWCPQCRAYREDAVTTALPRYRLGLQCCCSWSTRSSRSALTTAKSSTNCALISV